MKEGACETRGLMKLSTKREMFYVGDPLPLTIGCPEIDSLCDFGW